MTAAGDEAPRRARAERKPNSVERAYETLKHRVMNNELPAGANYFEPELAELLGVNRMVAHEAAALLARDGLVELRPRRGLRVVPITRDDLNEIYDILTELEGLAAERAGERGLQPEERAVMTAALEEMDRAMAAEDRVAWALGDERFHKGLARFSGSARLAQAIERHWDQAHRARMSTLHLRPAPPRSAAEHTELLAALDDRDPARAKAVHRAHRRRSRAMLLEVLRKHRLAQL